MARIHTTDREKMKLLSNAQLVRPLTRDVLAATISRISTLPSEVALSAVLLNLVSCAEPGLDFNIALARLPENASKDIEQILATNLVAVSRDKRAYPNPFINDPPHIQISPPEFDLELETSQVFSVWAQLSANPSRSMTGEERSLITERLLDGYLPDQLISAIRIAKSDLSDRSLLLVDVIGKRNRVRSSLEKCRGH